MKKKNCVLIVRLVILLLYVFSLTKESSFTCKHYVILLNYTDDISSPRKKERLFLKKNSLG